MIPFLDFLFWWHDWASAFLRKYLFTIKKLILITAHLSLFGFLFPDMRRDFGKIAEVLLLALLFLSPLARIFRTRLLLQLMSFRREFGIWMAYLATVHGVGYLIDPQWVAIFVEPYMSGKSFPINPTYFFGVLAYLFTLPLLFTSNNLTQRLLNGRNWKHLHRVVYIVLILVLLHHFSIQQGLNASGWFQTIVLMVLYIVLKMLAWKNFLSPLQKVIGWVASRYRDFTVKNMVHYKD